MIDKEPFFLVSISISISRHDLGHTNDGVQFIVKCGKSDVDGAWTCRLLTRPLCIRDISLSLVVIFSCHDEYDRLSLGFLLVFLIFEYSMRLHLLIDM